MLVRDIHSEEGLPFPDHRADDALLYFFEPFLKQEPYGTVLGNRAPVPFPFFRPLGNLPERCDHIYGHLSLRALLNIAVTPGAFYGIALINDQITWRLLEEGQPISSGKWRRSCLDGHGCAHDERTGRPLPICRVEHMKPIVFRLLQGFPDSCIPFHLRGFRRDRFSVHCLRDILKSFLFENILPDLFPAFLHIAVKVIPDRPAGFFCVHCHIPAPQGFLHFPR